MTSIETRRLQLRPLGEADATGEYLDWLNDPEVNRYLETRHASHSLESIRAFIRATNADPAQHLFGITLRSSGRHIGNIKLGPVRREHRLADIGLMIGVRAAWGKGYAAEAIAAVTDFSFAELGLMKLSAGAYAPNRGSVAAFLKAGWREEGLRLGHYLLDGEPCDVVELGIRRADWTRRHVL